MGVWAGTPPQRGEFDREIPLKGTLGDVVEEEEFVKTIASCRVVIVDRSTNTYHRLESNLEAGLVKILLARHDTLSIKAQDGPYSVVVEGKTILHIVDVRRTADDGSITYFVVKAGGRTARETEALVKLLNNQLPKSSRDRFVLVTNKDITKGRVNAAGNILHTREVRNDAETSRVHDALLECGGRAKVWHLAHRLPDLHLANLWTAVWDLIDRGLAIHDHQSSANVLASAGSWIRAVSKE